MSTSIPEPTSRAEREREWSDRARAYATYAVPKNRPYAARLVELLDIQPGERVLDVASGPGVVAVEAAQRTGAAGGVLATDLAPVWDAWIRDAAAERGLGNLRFAAMPGERLDLPDASFDVVACQFGLMFMTDRDAALREMHRVLKPGGRLGVAVWSTGDRVGHFAPMRALQSVLPEPEGGKTSPSPVSMGAPGLIEGLVAAAGFENVALHSFTASHVLDSAEAEWHRLSEEGMFSQRLAAVSDETRARVRDAVLASIEAMRVDGELRMTSEALIVTARRPA